MLPRWFRVVVAAEVAGLMAFVVLGVHVLTAGVHTAAAALGWMQSPRATATAPPSRDDTLPSLVTTSASPPPRAVLGFGAAMLSPSLLIRLNRDTGATAVGEYALLLNLEAVARGEITRLLAGISTARAGGR